MVSSGGNTRAAVKSDIAYAGHYGNTDLELDTGEVLRGPDAAERAVDRWDIDLSRGLGRLKQTINITLSMPDGTPPENVLAASRQFAKEHFPNNRWAMALHTNTSNPHTHLVVKSEGRDGKRLRITRETLRDYRSSFAAHLRELGVPANATLNAARGKFREPKEGRAIGFLAREGKSTAVKTKTVEVLRDLASGAQAPSEPIKAKLLGIRHDVLLAWAGTMRQLQAEGHTQLAADVGKFVSRFEPVRTEREKMTEKAREHLREKIKENRGLDANRDALTR